MIKSRFMESFQKFRSKTTNNRKMHWLYCINQTNLSKTKGLQAWVLGKIFFQIHFILTSLAGIIFFSNLHGYFNCNHSLYFPHELQQRPRNFMHEYWCLKRYPYQLFLSLHPFRLIFFKQFMWTRLSCFNVKTKLP